MAADADVSLTVVYSDELLGFADRMADAEQNPRNADILDFIGERLDNDPDDMYTTRTHRGVIEFGAGEQLRILMGLLI